MTDLFLVPIGEEWIEEFERTLDTPVSFDGEPPQELLGESEARVWGTTEGEDSKKRSLFEAMDPGDLILFLHEGSFFASGRVGTTCEDPELGDWFWDSPESRFIYTVTDYREISVSRDELWDLLGYSSNYPLYGFSRASDDAISSILQTYNSVEEAFQELRGEEVEEPEPEQVEGSEGEEGEVDTRDHTEIQWYLIQLGLEHGYDVYVATNDQNLTYRGQRLGEHCVDELNLTGFSESAMHLIEYVDVIWLKGDYIEKMFEVESTTSIYSGILRMTDFVVKVPNLTVDMHIVAAGEDEDQVRRQMTRPTFQHILESAQHCTLSYLSFEEVREKRQLVEQAGPLQDVF